MIKRPAKAFILAAGFGTRLLPLTRAVPKPLLPLQGRAMLDRALDLVQEWGVTDVAVNVHHGADALVRHVIQERKHRMRIQISFEPEILGTGGALARASWFFADQKPFWMVNADVVASVDSKPILKAFIPGKTIASAWLMASRGPRTVECEKGSIVDFQSKRPGTDGTFTFCGIHLVDPAVLEFLPREGFASIIDAYKRAMTKGWRVAGVPVENAFWADIGTPDQYLNAEADFAKYNPVKTEQSNTVFPVRISLASRMIYGPGIAKKKYAGVMALQANSALDEHERELTSHWVKSLEQVVACPLAPRGSARSFTRLYYGKKSAILVRHKPDREENNVYTSHTHFLKRVGIPVPDVLAENKKLNLALFSDAGEISVQDVAVSWSAERLENLYRDVLDTVVIFHEKGFHAAQKKSIRLMPPFDRKLYEWEHNLFTGLFLKERVGISDPVIRAISKELSLVSRQLLRLRPVLVHRDLQSSNIVLKGRRWSLIDYQGMRFGPAVYDLASLLCDPYIRIKPDTRARLLRHYADRADKDSKCGEMFWCGAVQRLGQALGAYARLGKLPGTAHFIRYIRPALANVQEALGHMDNVPVLKTVIEDSIARESKSS